MIVTPPVESEKFSAKGRQEYLSGLCMFLYLVKHLHPDLVDMTRELTKQNNGVNSTADKELLCMIKYVLGTTNVGLKIEPTRNSNNPWIVHISDCNCTGEPVKRRKNSNFILYVLGLLVSW